MAEITHTYLPQTILYNKERYLCLVPLIKKPSIDLANLTNLTDLNSTKSKITKFIKPLNLTGYLKSHFLGRVAGTCSSLRTEQFWYVVSPGKNCIQKDDPYLYTRNYKLAFDFKLLGKK
jgi:hypothetical protein